MNQSVHTPSCAAAELSDEALLRFSRHILLDEIGIEGQTRLQQATILVVGCGGLGAAALPFLAAAGVGRLLIADDDLIDETNLQRQILYTEADIGSLKVEAAARRLNDINSNVEVETFATRLDGQSLPQLVASADVVLDCTDNFATRHFINEACVVAHKPLVSGAAVRFEGQLAVYRPDIDDSPCYACLFDGEHAEDGVCALFGVFAPLVGIIGTAQAAEALKIVLKIGQPQHGVLKLYHALNSEWQTFSLPKNPHCRVCGNVMPSE